jgi:endoribonuclease Dicer
LNISDIDSIQYAVIVHDVVLASALDTTSAFAARRASESALDALEGDAQFLTRTCDCRTHAQARKAQKKAMKQILSGFADDEEEDLLSVEGVLAEDSRPKPAFSGNNQDDRAADSSTS